MRTIARLLGIAVVVAAAALGTAGPSSAEQTMEGYYIFNAPGQPQAEWTIYPICVPTVGDLRVPLELPVACTLKVVSATKNKSTFELNNLNWGGDARLTGGKWTLITRKEEGLQCPDGSTAPTTDTYQFDDVTLTGTHTSLNIAICGVPAGMKKESFTLAYDRPLPIPVDKYPLVCEPAGLRLCR
ncbi:hypothetical protein [Mycolicibacterium sp. 120270]|uniref:hypothetical protein n=1 Tax=Mycolicibacterium sp. 120270 TaxID=3090600 RepID=UPI00299DECD8|nr:hypothetical protein [Mycolicibacterium sp. 120270]MDX1881896.1 hypothetical protein [Mycolicibacterium sp. 120270]